MSFLEVNREAAMAVDRTASVSLLMALEKNYSDYVIQALMAVNKKAFMLLATCHCTCPSRIGTLAKYLLLF